MRTTFPFSNSASLRSGMLTRTRRTVALANSGALGPGVVGTDVCRAALTVVIASTAAKTQIAFLCRFALPFPSFIAPLLFASDRSHQKKKQVRYDCYIVDSKIVIKVDCVEFVSLRARVCHA